MKNFKNYLKEDVMKALSVKQPWAWLIVNGHKDIENRTWNTNFRGRFLVHASNNFDKEGYNYVKNAFPHISLPQENEFNYGGVVGSVELLETVIHSDSPWFDGKYGFVLKNPQKFDFVPYRGNLKFFNVNI